jgi:hypothetical protein
MRGLVFAVAAVGCHATTNAPRSTEPMPLPGESSGAASVDEPSFRLDPDEHPGRLSEDDIETVLQHAHPDVTACYERVLAVKPDVQGTANTIFVIGSDGAVTAAASSGVEPQLARCIDDVVTRRVFPPPRGGTVKVRYPFTFTRVGGDTSPATTSDYGVSTAAPASRGRVTCGRRR